MGRFLASLIIMLAVTFFAVANADAMTVYLDEATKRYDLGLFAEYLEDASGTLDIDDVMSAQQASRWKPNTVPTPNLAFSKSVYWFRLSFHSTLSTTDTWLFEIAFPLQDYIDYFVVQDRQVVHHVKTGDRLPFNSREIEFRNFLFSLEIPPGERRQVYLRLDTNDGLHEPLPMILWEPQEFTLQHGLRNLGLGLYFGIMVVMALYNLFVFVSVRDITYFYYVVYILGFSAWLFTYYGFSYQYLWPNSPDLANQAIVVLTSFWAIFMAQFVRSFLNAKEYLPWFDRFVLFYMGSMVLTIVMSFWADYSLGILSVIGFGVPACASGIYAGYASLKSGYRPALYFLLAWSALLISLAIFSLKISGLLPPLWFIERSIQIGSALEVVLLSLGLADRINSLRKEIYLAQKESIKAYESSLKIKNDFIASITHELRTPMNAILGGVEVADTNNSIAASESLKIIRSGANDMMELVDDILIHTELQSGQLTVEKNNANVSYAMDRLIRYYGSLCKDRGLDFQYEVDDKVPEWIVTDRRKLTVILTKLLNNAVKFTEQGTVQLKVSIETGVKPHQLVCAVYDTGQGIPKDKQEIIFDPFVQVEGGFTRRHGGMGIGLSICRRLAEVMNGTVDVESTEGRGSCFTLRLPLEVGEPVSKSKAFELAPSDLPILVVEDNLVNQKVVVKLLEKLGFESLVANHGQEAVDILEQHKVSLILMDLQMPVMDGLSCTETIRNSTQVYKSIPIVAVTANVMDADKLRCKEVGMNDFLEKPLKLNVLRECLVKYVNIPRSLT